MQEGTNLQQPVDVHGNTQKNVRYIYDKSTTYITAMELPTNCCTNNHTYMKKCIQKKKKKSKDLIWSSIQIVDGFSQWEK